MKSAIVKPERPGGFLDLMPAEHLARETMIRTIESVFRSYGFDSIETPAIEFAKTLEGETSDTGKNIFRVRSEQEDEPLAMRFDHTVPFARLLAANPYDPKKRQGIRLPWRRMVCGPVFRGEKPQSGRYRQFLQFDMDIAGSTDMMADAEIVAVMHHAFQALKIDRFIIRLNNRRILNGLAALVGIGPRGRRPVPDIVNEMMRILDKADKIGMDEVIKLLQAPPKDENDSSPALSMDGVAKVRAFLALAGDNREKLAQCRELFAGIAEAERGIDELTRILNYLPAMGISEERVRIDFSIARGLDYYTGPVMETVLEDAPGFGSVFSGGRYDGLVQRFTGNDLPSVGASIGVDRLFAALTHIGLVDTSKATASEVMVLRLAPDKTTEYLRIASEIRALGINTEISLEEDPTFKSQFSFAVGRGVRFAVICGEDEFREGRIQVKNLATREQTAMQREALADYFRERAVTARSS